MRRAAAAKLSAMRSARLAVVLDVCCVLIFVIIGRASHTKGESLAGIASTSWPFLAGLGIGWLAARGWRRPLAIRPEGLAIWLCTVALVLDVCCVLVFVIIGRASHTKGEAVGGIASTAWPFLAGLAAGWLAARAWRRPLALRPTGIAVWLCTVALGMVLRVVSGQGTAPAFIVVALAFLGLFLLGWRLLARLAAAKLAAR